MATVSVGRFLDLSEAQVVVSALRASGIFAFIQSETLAQVDPNLQYAMGGVCLLVPEDQAQDARDFIAAHRHQPSQLEPLPPVKASLRAVLSAVIGLGFGLATPLRFGRRKWIGDDQQAE